MTTFYAFCWANGPISVDLGEFDSLEKAVEYFSTLNHRDLVDEPRVDYEDAYGLDCGNMSYDDFWDLVRKDFDFRWEPDSSAPSSWEIWEEKDKHSFSIHTVDFGDRDHEKYGDSVWIAAHIDGDPNKGIGAYVRSDGGVETNDFTGWSIENDLVELGLDPDSDEAEKLVADWVRFAQKAGAEELKKL